LPEAGSKIAVRIEGLTREFRPPAWRAYFHNIEAFLDGRMTGILDA
jgi:hypothetical protein